MLSEVIAVLTLIFIAYYKMKFKLPTNIPPGPLRFPGIGNLVQLLLSKEKTPFGIFQELSKKYGTIMFLQLGNVYQVVVEDCNIIKELLSDEVWTDRLNSKYLEKRSFGKSLGVLMSGGNCWKEMRRFSVRTLRDFGFGKQKSMEISLQNELTDLTTHLKNQIYTNGGQTRVSMKKFFTISIINVLWNMIAGTGFSHDDPKIRELMEIIEKENMRNAIGSLTAPLFLYSIFPFLLPIISYFTTIEEIRTEDQNRIHQFFREILNERRAEGCYRIEQRDYIDVFLREIDAHKNDPPETNLYTDEQFIVLTMDLFMAGSETINTTIEFAILYLMKNPQVQKKVQEEIDAVVGHNRLPSISDKLNMPYVEVTILEVQRYANVVPIIVRTSTKDTTLGGYQIPAGTSGLTNIYSIHMDEKTWGDPLNFRPERFLNSQNQIVNAEKILPFGTGKRVCLGESFARASLFMYITTMLQKFSFEESPLHILPSNEPILGFTLNPQPYYAVIKLRRTHGVTYGSINKEKKSKGNEQGRLEDSTPLAEIHAQT